MGIKTLWGRLQRLVLPRSNASQELRDEAEDDVPLPGEPVRPGPSSERSVPPASEGGVLTALFSRKRGEVRRRRRLLGGIFLVVLLFLGGGVWWGVLRRERSGAGPDLRKATPLEELLYAPLGVPLVNRAMRDFEAQGGLRQRSTVLPIPPSFVGSRDLVQISARGMDALFVEVSREIFPVALRVTGPRWAVKWGLRPGEARENVLRHMGFPGQDSGDRWTYRDGWGSTVGFFFFGDRIQAVEWHYPPGLLLP